MFSSHIVIPTARSKIEKAAIRNEALRQRRREKTWAWLTLFALILCWDASIRLDQRVSPPRVRVAHVGEAADVASVAVKRR